MSALRAFRLLRVIRMAIQIESLRILLSGVIDSLHDVFYLIIILCIFSFMFAVLGQNLFGIYICFFFVLLFSVDSIHSL